MLPSLNRFKGLLENDSIGILNRENTNIFHDYSIIYIIEQITILDNKTIFENFNNSSVVIINQLDNSHFILSFKKTLLIINQDLIQFINTLISSNTNIKFCFLINNQDTFIQKINHYNEIRIDDNLITENTNLINQNNIIETDRTFKIEIDNFNNKILFKNAKFLSKEIINNIISSITGYLIKESYSKLDDKHDYAIYSQIDKKSLIGTFKENDFIELRSIGIGSSWEAKLMFHIDKEELYVMKQLRNIIDDRLFEREMNNYININYPLIPKFYGTIENKKVLIIEFINGHDLSNIKAYNFSETDKNTIYFQLLMIFNYLHKNGFIYRDLRPENVLIDAKNRVYLIDFDSMLKITDILDKDNFSNNYDSPFVSPEVNNGSLSYFVDIYSLYMMLFYILNEIIPTIQYNDIISNYINKIRLRKNQFPINDMMLDYYTSNYSLIDITLIPDDPSVLFDLGTVHFHDDYDIQDDKKVIYFYSRAAKLNHLEAIFLLGCFYFEGKCVKKDIYKAFDYFLLAANKNHPKAQYNIGIFYSYSKYGNLDINKAIKYFSLAANQDCLDAQYELACIYYSGEYIERNIKKAIHYFSLAAQKNHPDAEFKLGIIYFNELSVQDINKAIQYFQLAAEHNHQYAQHNVGCIYYIGQYVTKDINKAVHYFTLAANQGNAESQFTLGNIYNTYDYVTRDIEKAIYYFSLAAKQNHLEAQYKLGCIYALHPHINQNIQKAIYYFSLASDQNYSKAQYILGNIYFTDEYKVQNIEKAIHYFTLAANQGNEDALYILGDIYYSGLYVQKDITKAIQYFLSAAKLNHREAKFFLGNIYYSGLYVPKDIGQAIYYYSLASDQNHPIAQYNLGCIYFNVKKDIKKGFYYFSLAADHGLAEAQFNIGTFYYNGQYITKDINKAIHYFSLAARQGFAEANFILGIIYLSGYYVARNTNNAINYFSLASNKNHANAQFILGSIYYLGIYLSKNLNRGQNYLILSSKNGNRQANFAHGFLLHEKKNIIDAINYYKQSSSFNNQYAKNNLGIIYKNGYGKEIKSNKSLAIEYFKEAIRQKNDFLSMYNLAHLYIYDESFKQNINDTIKLLIKSSNLFYSSMVLLCLLFVKHFGNHLTSIEQEIKKPSENNTLFKRIRAIISIYDLLNKKNFDFVYELYRKKDFLYNIGLEPILSSSIDNAAIKNIPKYPNAQNISSLFYEGFGIKI